ncbi:hypothetical protein [Kitasatospora sp. LaBMicrA B282]|uniref:hypothetical protein n=1 Tax=Kitasatospora sp. LaBMicrA B282 TaxID=3420949 RepID=UPI003D118B39
MTTSVPGAGAGARTGRVLLGFALLLVLLFAASYAVGRWVGPTTSGPARPAGGSTSTDRPGMRMAPLPPLVAATVSR